MSVIGYSPKRVVNAFDPPISAHAIKLALSTGSLVSRRIGTSRVILADDLKEWVRSQPTYKSYRRREKIA